MIKLRDIKVNLEKAVDTFTASEKMSGVLRMSLTPLEEYLGTALKEALQDVAEIMYKEESSLKEKVEAIKEEKRKKKVHD